MIESRKAVLVFGLFVATGCHRPSKPAASETCAVTVFAASSLSDLVEAIRRDFVAEHPTCKVTFNFGASNALGLQIEAGARAHVFLSAAGEPVNHLIDSGKAQVGPKRVLFSNRLALIGNSSNPVEIKDACALKEANVARLAIGQPDAVPAGAYAKAYLSNIKCPDGKSPWQKLENRLLPMPNARAVLSVVEQQPKLFGFVYQTDVLSSRRAKTQFIVVGPAAPRIDYYGVRVGPTGQERLAEAFLAEFAKPGVQKTIREMGFVIDKS